MPSSRRGRGEGSIYQRCDHKSCPPLNAAGERPDHTCHGRWCVVVDFGWSAGRRQRKKVYGNTKAEAIAKADELRRGPKDIARGDHTIETWMNYWLQEVCPSRVRPSTLMAYESKTSSYIIPLLGKHRLDQIEPRHVRDMYNRMRMECPSPVEVEGRGDVCPHRPSHGLTESTLRATHGILKRALKIAIRERQTTENVAGLVDPPGTETAIRIRLTPPQARLALAAGRDTGYEARWYLALHQGMRQGEVLGLSWSMVNLEEATITVARILVRKQGGGYYFGEPKSRASSRTIPMTPATLAHLKVHYAGYLNECLMAGVDPDPMALVFHQDNGEPIAQKTDWKRWVTLLDIAGVPQVTLHSARQTTAALLEESGVPVRLAAEILGHADEKMTYRYQRDAGLDNRRKAIAALGAAWDNADKEDPA